MTRILLIEDDAVTHLALRRALALGGHDVLSAYDGEDARRRLEADGDTIDIVVTDVQMPGTAGAPLIELILRLAPAASLLVISGSSPRELERLGIDPETAAVIEKRFDLPWLARLVDAGARRGR